MWLLAVSTKSNKTNSEKFSVFFYISLQKQHNSLMYWLLMYCGQKIILSKSPVLLSYLIQRLASLPNRWVLTLFYVSLLYLLCSSVFTVI